MVNKIEDLDNLAQAIHYLKEAQQLEQGEEFDPLVTNARLDMVDNAMEAIVCHVEEEKAKVPFDVNRGP